MSRPPAALERDAEVSVYVSGRPDRRLADPESMGPRTRRRRAFALVLLTLAFPGSAQLAAGSRTVGRVALRCWLALWALALLFGLLFLVNRGWFLGLFGRAWFLSGLQWVLLGFALFWGALFLDAWRLGQPGRLVLRARRWLTALTAGMLVMTSGGLVYAASNVAAGKDALNALFSGNRAVEPTDGRYNILLLGGDTGKSRVGTRPDSIQLVSVDADTGRAVTFGFSRDMENIDFRPGSVMQRLMPEGWNCGDECLLNGLYTWAEDHRDQFPTGTQSAGVLATREAVEAVSGLDVHYYAMVDLRGFRKMVDAVGGVDLTVQRRTPIGGGTSPVVGWIEPGRQHLDGYHALWYARSRHGSTNYERMARQRCVMTALVDQVDPQTVLTRFQKIAAASSGLIRTDLPQSELGYFADLAMKTRTQKIKSVNFVPPLIKPWDYDPAFVHQTVRSTISASEKSKEKPKKATVRVGAGTASAPRATPRAAAPAPAAAAPSAPGASAPGGQAAESDLSAVCAS
jgi:polyisoprenyl-teichoic acid--peptidoglycan teichoic acid transferase